MNPGESFQGISESLHTLFSHLLRPLGSTCLVLPDSTALFVRPSSPADVATLPQATSLCHRYLKLAGGDVALTNDPYSGGTVLSDFTLVIGISFHPTNREIDLLLARRIQLAPHLPARLKVDEEGVRVPPTPLLSAGVLNKDLLQAIATHAMAPPGLFSAVSTALEELILTADRLKKISRDPGSILRRAGFQTYLEDSRRVFESLMAKLPLGTVIVSTQLSSGENLKLQLKITENKLLFDFAGSDNSNQVALTELATFGACWAATVAGVGEAIPMNWGTFQFLQVSAPSRTFLSAMPPSATLRGMLEGTSVVSRLVHEAIGKLQASYRVASGPEANGRLQIIFADRRVLSLQAPPGAGAGPQTRGADAASPWSSRERFLRNPEVLEQDFPVQIIEAGRRSGSGGSGAYLGGRGCILALQMKTDGELRWMDSSLGRRSAGLDGGRAGAQTAIEIIRVGQTAREEHLKPQGSTNLNTGDRVYILSGGGGGFGAPPSATDGETGTDVVNAKP